VTPEDLQKAALKTNNPDVWLQNIQTVEDILRIRGVPFDRHNLAYELFYRTVMIPMVKADLAARDFLNEIHKL
jgi:hypothetical protein